MERPESVFRLGEAARWLRCAVDPRHAGLRIRRVVTDSRGDCRDALFVGIRGERFDGGAFAEEAFRRGALAAVLEKPRAARARGPVLRVADARVALAVLARCRLERMRAKVVAVTGSCGKTTTREMTRLMLAGRYRVHAAPESFNNDIGVPLTLLSAPRGTEVMLVEFGTNSRGEISLLCKTAPPHVAVITQIAPAHIGRLGSMTAIWEEKCDVMRGARAHATGVLNVAAWRHQEVPPPPGGGLLRTGLTAAADLRAEIVGLDGARLRFRVGGHEGALVPPARHLVECALCALGVAETLGVERGEALEALSKFVPPKMRLRPKLLDGILMVNDAYNANPASVKAAARFLADLPVRGRRVMVLGEMRELGGYSEELHREVGAFVAECVDTLICVGAAAAAAGAEAQRRGATVFVRDDPEEVGVFLSGMLRPGDAVLLKASRAMRLERTAALLEKARPRRRRKGKNMRTA